MKGNIKLRFISPKMFHPVKNPPFAVVRGGGGGSQTQVHPLQLF